MLDFFVEFEFMQQKFGSVRYETKFVPESKRQHGPPAYTSRIRASMCLRRPLLHNASFGLEGAQWR
jgi:hypothetical protein